MTGVEEYSNNLIRVLRLGAVPRSTGFPRGSWGTEFRKVRGRRVEGVVLHQLGGLFERGLDAVQAYADHSVALPTVVPGRGVVGGGLGLPGPAHTFFAPSLLDATDGLFTVYRLWSDEWCTGHTGSGWAERGVSVAVGGSLCTRHTPSPADRDPDRSQFRAVRSLVLDYLLPRYGLGPESVFGGFDAGEPRSPGDVYEAWVRDLRGEELGWLDPGRLPWLDPGPEQDELQLDLHRPLATRAERVAVLEELGYHPAGKDGLRFRSAIRAFQMAEHLIVDGYWGPMTERAVRAAVIRP